MQGLEDHPIAGLFPLIEGEDFAALVADIKANGLIDAIDLYEGKILDGRNRYRAALSAGIELEKRNFRAFHPEFYGNPLTYVLAKNLKRRHLNVGQRAMVADSLATMRQGERTDIAPGADGATEPSANLPKVAQKEAARELSISERALRHAHATRQTGAPELVRAVERGKLPVSAAAQAARLAPDIQRRIAEKAEAGESNVVRTVIKQEVRAVRERDLGAKQSALPTKKYGLILADPEWRFEPYSRETGMDRAPDNHYSTSPTEEIANRDVRSIAADDSILLLWAIAPMLPDALSVMIAWGFEYKSHLIWDKVVGGTGYWFIGRHELLLIGTRGHVVAPAMGTQLPSIVASAKGRHSAKPDLILEWIDRTFPSLPKIELNRRGPARPGWDAWGNESESLPPHDPETGEILAQDAVAPTPDASLGRPAPVMETAGAGTHSSEIDPYEIPEFCRRKVS